MKRKKRDKYYKPRVAQYVCEICNKKLNSTEIKVYTTLDGTFAVCNKCMQDIIEANESEDYKNINLKEHAVYNESNAATEGDMIRDVGL